jgi:hypothetical protein
VPPPAPALLCALALLACHPEPDAAPSAPTAPAARATPSPAPAPIPEPPPVRARLADCTARDRNGLPIGPGEHASAHGSWSYLDVAAGDRCKIVRGADLVYQIHGPARAQATTHRLPSLLLREGTLQVDLAAGALTPDSGFWFNTPSARVDLVQGSRVVARAHAAGGTHVYVVSGQVRVQPTGDAEPAAQLAAGQGLAISSEGRATPVEARLARVEEALTWLGAQRPPAGARGAALQALVAAASQTFGQVEAGQERLHAMSRTHGQHAAGSPEAMALQRAIATESGKQLAAQRRFSAQEEALRAWTLDPDEPGVGALRELLGRVDQWQRRNSARSRSGPDGRGR